MRAEILASALKELRNYSNVEWELFVEEWCRGLAKRYAEVKRFGGPGDLGRDVVGFVDAAKFDGLWDNYQCKHLEKQLTPASAGLEIAKIIYHSFAGEFTPPRRMYFCCPRDVSMDLANLLGSPTKLRDYVLAHWDSGYAKSISAATQLKLAGSLLTWVSGYDYTIFGWYQTSEMMNDHRKTAHWATRFGGLLPPPPDVEVPHEVQPVESKYVAQLLKVYAEQQGCVFTKTAELTGYAQWRRDFDEQRERFYCAESFNRAYRDETPEGTIEQFVDDIHDSVKPIATNSHASGYQRMNSCLAQAAGVQTGGILAQHARPKIKQGVCHHLVNDERIYWLK
jgi:hypothetical protein